MQDHTLPQPQALLGGVIKPTTNTMNEEGLMPEPMGRAELGQEQQLDHVPGLTRGEAKEHRPSNSEVLRDYEITIKFLNRGCIVCVGCKSIAFESVTSAMKEINEYVNSPFETQKKWRALLDS
jgi:hypothetical protein